MICSWPYTCAGCEKLDSLEAAKEPVCYSCRFFGPDADMVPICHKDLKTMRPCKQCGGWKGR